MMGRDGNMGRRASRNIAELRRATTLLRRLTHELPALARESPGHCWGTGLIGDDALDTIDILKGSFVSISLIPAGHPSRCLRRQLMPFLFRRLLDNQEGGSAIEYALVCFLIALAAVTGFTTVGGCCPTP